MTRTMQLRRIFLLSIPFTGMVFTEVILIYFLENFNLTTLQDVYLNILEFPVALNLDIQPNLFFNFILSLILLIPLFFILKFIKTPAVNFQKKPVLPFAARIMLYGFIFITNSFLLGKNSYIAIVPYIYFMTLAVKFYEHYSLADFGFHAGDLLKNCGIGILFLSSWRYHPST